MTSVITVRKRTKRACSKEKRLKSDDSDETNENQDKKLSSPSTTLLLSRKTSSSLQKVNDDDDDDDRSDNDNDDNNNYNNNNNNNIPDDSNTLDLNNQILTVKNNKKRKLDQHQRQDCFRIPRTLRSTQHSACSNVGIIGLNSKIENNNVNNVNNNANPIKIESFAGDILDILIDKINYTPDYNCIVGVVAWATNAKFLRALSDRSSTTQISLLVQKEHFIKPSSLRRSQKKGRLGAFFKNDYGSFLQGMYAKLNTLDVDDLSETCADHLFLLPSMDIPA